MRCTEITEYPINLIGIDKNVIFIPKIIVTNSNKKILATYIYCYVRAGLDNVVDFSIGSLVRYFGYKTNSRKGRINEMFIDSIRYLVENNFIIGDIDFDNIKLNTIMSITFNRNKSNFENDYNYFAKLYVDELLDILDYCKTSSINVINMLSVFVYLRFEIGFRTTDNSDKSETFYHYYKQISEETKIGVQTLYKIINALYIDLNLIYVAHVKYKCSDENWVILPSIFCNYYRRKDGKVLDGGKHYYEKEVDRCYKQLIYSFKTYTGKSDSKSHKRNTTYENKDTNYDWFEFE